MAIYGSDQHVSDESGVVSINPCDQNAAKVKKMAKQAAYYVMKGKYLRMDYCDDRFFQCHDEDSGDEYGITYAEVDTGVSKFMKLVEVI